MKPFETSVSVIIQGRHVDQVWVDIRTIACMMQHWKKIAVQLFGIGFSWSYQGHCTMSLKLQVEDTSDHSSNTGKCWDLTQIVAAPGWLVKRPHLHQSMAQGFCDEMVCTFFWLLQQHQVFQTTHLWCSMHFESNCLLDDVYKRPTNELLYYIIFPKCKTIQELLSDMHTSRVLT